jgi:glyoxylate reductase
VRKSSVFVTRRIPDAGLELLKEELGGFDMNPADRVLSRRELLEGVRGREAVLCLLTDRIDAKVMEAAGPKVRIFSNMAVGVDNIDLAEATRRRILVGNTPGVLTEATAEMAWALLFAAARRVVESDRFTRAGRFKGWDPLLFRGAKVSGKTLGVVGAGRIGTAFALMSQGFKMNVLYTGKTPQEALEKKLGARRVDLPALLRESDFVSVHINLTRETRHLIGRKELALMKQSAILVNTSRGPVIHEAALVEALKNRKIGGAGLDVYEEEPRFSKALARLDNAVLTPHIASSTTDTRNRMALLAAENLVAALKGERPRHLANPEAYSIS